MAYLSLDDHHHGRGLARGHEPGNPLVAINDELRGVLELSARHPLEEDDVDLYAPLVNVREALNELGDALEERVTSGQ